MINCYEDIKDTKDEQDKMIMVARHVCNRSADLMAAVFLVMLQRKFGTLNEIKKQPKLHIVGWYDLIEKIPGYIDRLVGTLKTLIGSDASQEINFRLKRGASLGISILSAYSNTLE